jgi:uncharacterized phage infection (PIP) family protein YhgE
MKSLKNIFLLLSCVCMVTLSWALVEGALWFRANNEVSNMVLNQEANLEKLFETINDTVAEVSGLAKEVRNNQNTISTNINIMLNDVIDGYKSQKDFYDQSTKDWQELSVNLKDSSTELKTLLASGNTAVADISTLVDTYTTRGNELLQESTNTIVLLQEKLEDPRWDSSMDSFAATNENLDHTTKNLEQAAANLRDTFSPRKRTFWYTLATWSLKIADAVDVFNLWVRTD